MSRPRPVFPDTTYLVTRRCAQRQYLLLPCPAIKRVFLYCLAFAAKRFDAAVHGFCALSNHFHLELTDLHGNLPEFMQWFDGTIARCLNSYYKRQENFWASGTYNRVEFVGPEDVLDKLVYTLANPVAAGLVAEGTDWPGPRSGTLEAGPQKITVQRPDFFFQAEDGLPDSIELVVELPAAIVELQGGETGTMLRDAVHEREQEIRDQFHRERRGFKGRQGIFRLKHTDSPATDPSCGSIKPRVAARDRERRLLLIAALKQFVSAYREAFERFRAGVRDVIFPAGTYWLRVYCGVACHDPPAG